VDAVAGIRLATVRDVEQLVQMRWDFSAEDQDLNAANFEEFHQICSGETLVNKVV
jgi:hypothetical protein